MTPSPTATDGDRRGRRTRRGRGDDGVGLVGSLAGVVVFLAFLLFAAQLLVNLSATSMVTSAAYEGARLAAGRGVAQGDVAAQQEARRRGEERVRALLGRFGDRVRFDWSGSTGDVVVLRVQAEPPSVLLPALPAELGFDRIDRSVQVRVEDLR